MDIAGWLIAGFVGITLLIGAYFIGDTHGYTQGRAECGDTLKHDVDSFRKYWITK